MSNVEFDRTTVIFAPNVGPQVQNVILGPFSAPVLSTMVGLEGWELEFDTPAPVAHRVDEMQVDAQLVGVVAGPTGALDSVQVQASVNLKDANGQDNYRASVNLFAIALV